MVALIDADAASHAAALAADGVDEVIAVHSPVANFEAHIAARALEELIEAERPALVLVGHTIDSMGFAPAVAARARLGFASDVVALAWDGGPSARRGAYGDKLVDELEFPGKECTLLMVRPGAFAAATPRPIDSQKSALVMSTSPAATSRKPTCSVRAASASPLSSTARTAAEPLAGVAAANAPGRTISSVHSFPGNSSSSTSLSP